MKKMRKRLAGMLALAMFAVSITASVAAAEEEIPEIYTLGDENALNGMDNPYNIPDRSDIDKAWPKEPKDPDHLVIGWAEISMSNPWFVDVTNAADAKAEEYGMEIHRLVCEHDPILQSQHIDTFISQDVDMIVINPADIMSCIADIQRAVDAGIPVVSSATELSEADAPVLTCIASSPWGCGYEAGKYAAHQFDSSEMLTMGTILGVLGSPVSEGRVNGMLTGIIHERLIDNGYEYTDPEAYLIAFNFYQEIVKNGHAELPEANVKVVSQLVGNWTEEGGMDCTEDIITANPDVQLIVAENDWMGMGAYKAIVNAGRTDDIQVVCCADGVKDAIEMVKNGEMLSTGANSAVEQGEEVVGFIKKIFDGEVDPTNLPINVYFPKAAITGDNVDEYYNPDALYFDYEPMEFPSVPEYLEQVKTALGM